MKSYTYELYIGNGGTDDGYTDGWLDVSPLVNSKDTKIEYNLCNESFKSIADSASITLRYSNSTLFKKVAQKLIDFAGIDVLLRITKTTRNDGIRDNIASVYGTLDDEGILSINSGSVDAEGILTINDAVSEVIFIGYVAGGMSEYSTGFIPQNITLKAKSLEEKLNDVKISENKVFIGEMVGSIVSWIINYAASHILNTEDVSGLKYNVHTKMANTFMTASSLNMYAKVKYFVVTEDDKKTAKTVIDDLLFECGGYKNNVNDIGYGWVLDYNHSTGKFEIAKTTGYLTASDVTALSNNAVKRVHYNVKNKLNVTHSKNSKDGIAIKYYSTKTMLNTSVYVENIDNSIAEDKDNTGKDEDGLKAGTWKGVTVYTDSEVEQSGGTTGTDSLAGKNYYPNDSDVNATYQEYKKDLLDKAYQSGRSRVQDDNIDLVFVYEKSTQLEINATNMDGIPLSINGWTDIPASKWYEKAKVTRPQGRMISYPKKSWVVLHNKNNARVNLQSMSILGDVVYKDEEHQIVAPLKCIDPEEITLKYVSKSVRADASKVYLKDSSGNRDSAETDMGVTELNANDFAVWYFNSIVKGKDKITWTQTVESSDYSVGNNNGRESGTYFGANSFEVGQYAYVQLEGAERGIPCIIVQKNLTLGSVVKAEYTALSVGNFVSSADCYEKHIVANNTSYKSEYQKAVESGQFSGSEKEWVEHISGAIVEEKVEEISTPIIDYQQSSNTFIRNLRTKSYDSSDTNTYNPYDFTLSIANVDESQYSVTGWTFTGIVPDATPSSTGYYFVGETSITMNVPTKNTIDKITATVTYVIKEEEYIHSFLMDVEDVTEKAKYFGTSDGAEIEASANAWKYRDGDMYVKINSDSDRASRFFDGISWRDYEETDTNYNIALEAVKDILDGNNHVEANGFDWFGRLMANTIVANEMFARGLESPAYRENNNGFPTNGFNMKENKVKIYDLLANKGSFYDVKIEGDSSFNGALEIINDGDVILQTQNYVERSFTANGSAKYNGYYLYPYEFYRKCNDNVCYTSGRYQGKNISKIGYYTSSYTGETSYILNDGKISPESYWYEIPKTGNVAFKINSTNTGSESLNFRIYERKDVSSTCYIDVWTRTMDTWFEYGAKKGQWILLNWSKTAWFGDYWFYISIIMKPESYLADSSFTKVGLHIRCTDNTYYYLGVKGTDFSSKTKYSCSGGDYLYYSSATCYNKISGFSISGTNFPGVPVSATRASGTLTITDYDPNDKTISNVSNISISSAVFSDTMLAFYDTNGIRYEIEVGQGLRGFSFSLTNRGVSNKGIRTKNIFADNIVGMIVWMSINQAPVGFLMCNGGDTSGYPALKSVIGSTLPNISTQTLGNVTVYPYMYAGISGSDS